MAEGEIGGRTVQINDSGAVECATYDIAPLRPGYVRVHTVLSAISPGTEMTFVGRNASNVYLHKRWNEDLRLFEPGPPALDYPIAFGYRAAGEVVETRSPAVRVGERIYGNWRHTEFVSLVAERAAAQRVPEGIGWEGAVDLGQMGPICVNAAAFGEAEARGAPAVVFGAGAVGLLTAQVVRAGGASPVYVVDRLVERLAIAEGLGFETQVARVGVDVAVTLKRRHGPEGVPVAWECTGSVAALGEAIRVVRRQGLVVAVGFYQGPATELVLGDEFHHNAVRIISAQIGNPFRGLDRAELQQRTIALAEQGSISLGGLPSLTLPVEEAASGFAALERPAEVLQVALTY